MISNHLWQSTLFGAAAAVLAYALRHHRASVRFWIWMAASLKFLVPFAALVALGGRLPAPAPATVALAAPAAAIVEDAVFTLPAELPRTDWWPALLLAVWTCGSLLVIGRWILRWRRAIQSPALEPGVFGLFRPKLVLPAGIEQRLTAEQLRAVVAHEMAHIRRRDNLLAALHMVVEALFWFHPLVWWIGARLVEERERACDEDVIRQGADPQDYASGILEVCKFCLESPVACVSGVTGADLKRRIAAILTARVSRRLTLAGKLMLAGTTTVALAVPLLIGIALAQQDAFEVASVKPAPPGTTGVRLGFTPDGGVRIQNATLQNIIEVAFEIQRFQISGAPSWIASEQFVIEGKPPAGAATGDDAARKRLQRLLAERFQLKVRHETKEAPVLALTVAKGGSKMKESDTGDGLTGTRPGHIRGAKVGMALFSRWLSMVTGRPVVDRTGLTGAYDFELLWAFDPAGISAKGAGPIAEAKAAEAAANFPVDQNGPSLFTALQEQLGLKLEASKGPIEMIVIERIERPNAN